MRIRHATDCERDNKLTDETEAPWTGPKWKDASQAWPHSGRERLLGPGVVLVATIRPDGTPRLSPVEPFIMDGTLWLSMLWQSRKATGLERDPHILVHSVTTNRDGKEGEFKLRGLACPEESPAGPANRISGSRASVRGL